jgi:hypothetical protein
MLGAAWDTLGWILHARGRTAKGLLYVRAAWSLRQDAATGEHLAQIYWSLGRKQEAEYQFALARVCPGAGAQEVPDLYYKVTGHLGPGQGPFLDKGGHLLPKPMDHLLAVRTYRLPSYSGAPTGGLVRLVLTRTGVASAEILNGDPAIGAMLPAVRSLRMTLDLPDEGPERIERTAVLTLDRKASSLVLVPLV